MASGRGSLSFSPLYHFDLLGKLGTSAEESSQLLNNAPLFDNDSFSAKTACFHFSARSTKSFPKNLF